MHTIRNSLNTKTEQNKSQVYKSNTSLAYKIRISANSATDTISTNMEWFTKTNFINYETRFDINSLSLKITIDRTTNQCILTSE